MGGPARAAEELNALVWCDHTDPALIQPFEEKHGVKVNLKEYEGTGSALAIIEQSQPGDWDVFVVDGVDVPRVIEAGLLAELPADQLPIGDVFEQVQMLDVTTKDGKTYAIMEKFGYNVISYNKAKVDPADMRDLATLWSDKYKGRIAVYDYYIPLMDLVALKMGMKPSDITEETLPAMKDELFALKDNSVMVGEVVSSTTALATGEGGYLDRRRRMGGCRAGEREPGSRLGAAGSGRDPLEPVAFGLQGFAKAGPGVGIRQVHHEPGRPGAPGDVVMLLGHAGQRRRRARS